MAVGVAVALAVAVSFVGFGAPIRTHCEIWWSPVFRILLLYLVLEHFLLPPPFLKKRKKKTVIVKQTNKMDRVTLLKVDPPQDTPTTTMILSQQSISIFHHINIPYIYNDAIILLFLDNATHSKGFFFFQYCYGNVSIL